MVFQFSLPMIRASTMCPDSYRRWPCWASASRWRPAGGIYPTSCTSSWPSCWRWWWGFCIRTPSTACATLPGPSPHIRPRCWCTIAWEPPSTWTTCHSTIRIRVPSGAPSGTPSGGTSDRTPKGRRSPAEWSGANPALPGPLPCSLVYVSMS